MNTRREKKVVGANNNRIGFVTPVAANMDRKVCAAVAA